MWQIRNIDLKKGLIKAESVFKAYVVPLGLVYSYTRDTDMSETLYLLKNNKSTYCRHYNCFH